MPYHENYRSNHRIHKYPKGLINLTTSDQKVTQQNTCEWRPASSKNARDNRGSKQTEANIHYELLNLQIILEPIDDRNPIRQQIE